MAWVYLDDQFPDHPKIVLAGGDAGWLWACGLAYVRRYNTDGLIPKAQVPKLSDRKNPLKLARRLVEVGLWEERGEHYAFHDYGQWNKPQASRSEAARKAAQTRWGRQQSNAPPDANAYADASPDAYETQCEGTAEGDASECPPPLPPVVTSVDNSRRLCGDASDDDEAQRIADQDRRIQQAVLLLAQTDLDRRQQAGHLPPLGDPESWLREAITRRSERQTNALLELLNLNPDATPEQLADALEPGPQHDTPANGDTPPRPPEHVAGAEPSPWLKPPADVLAATRDRLAHPNAGDRR